MTPTQPPLGATPEPSALEQLRRLALRTNVGATEHNAMVEAAYTTARAAATEAEKVLAYIDRQVREVWSPTDTYQSTHRQWCMDEARRILSKP